MEWTPDEYDFRYNAWKLQVDTATDEAASVLAPVFGPIPSVTLEKMVAVVEEAHTVDDPEWQFSFDRLVEKLVDLATYEGHPGLPPETYELVEIELGAIFPVAVM